MLLNYTASFVILLVCVKSGEIHRVCNICRRLTNRADYSPTVFTNSVIFVFILCKLQEISRNCYRFVVIIVPDHPRGRILAFNFNGFHKICRNLEV